MNADQNEDALREILDARAGRSALTSGASHPLQDAELHGLLEVADVAWLSQQHAPDLEEDPVAAMLGLVPDPEIGLDGAALKTARKRASLAISTLAGRLVARGWQITARELMQWENGRNVPRTPALIRAIAEEAGANPDKLTRRLSNDPERQRLAGVRSSPLFRELAERWARIQGTTVALAESALESRMAVAVHRGDAPETDVLLESLEAMVSALESRDPE